MRLSSGWWPTSVLIARLRGGGEGEGGAACCSPKGAVMENTDSGVGLDGQAGYRGLATQGRSIYIAFGLKGGLANLTLAPPAHHLVPELYLLTRSGCVKRVVPV